MEYSIFERSPGHCGLSCVVAGHEREPLVVDEVVFDSLQNGGGWDLDASGYNFRHDFKFERPRRAAPGQIEILYLLRSIFGEVTVIRFQIRGQI